MESYPARLEIDYPDELSRVLIFVKWLLVIPNLIVLLLFSIVVFVAQFAGWWVILFTGRMPPGIFNLIVGYLRWNQRVNAYAWLLTDQYPPFSPDAKEGDAVRLEVDYPERLSRLLIFVKWLLIIPHAIVLYFFTIVAYVITMLAWFAILFTGQYPRGLFDIVVGYYRWTTRVNAYANLLRDEYPPFSSD